MDLFLKTLETLPEEMTEVTIESNESSSEILESSAIIDSETSVSLEAVEIIENVNDSISEIKIEAAPVMAAAASGSVSFDSNDLIYTIRFNNSEYRVLFPENMREYLIVRDGYLLNSYGSSIVGLVLDSGDSAETTTFHDRFITLYPFTNTSGNSSAHRYGGYAYLTTYSAASSTQLTSTTTYGNVTVIQKPAFFRGFSSFELIVLLCLGLTVLTGFFRGFRS